MVNLLTDGLPALALGVDPAAEGVMSRKPRSPKERIIGWPMVRTIMLVGSVMCIGVLALFKWALVSGLALEAARSVAFTGVVAFQLFNVFNSRSADKSAFRSGMPSPWTFAAVGSSIALQLGVVYLPVMQGLFGTAALSVAWLGGILLVAASVLAIVEAYKFIIRRVAA
jgi:Ca2+-transporting ATPase